MKLFGKRKWVVFGAGLIFGAMLLAARPFLNRQMLLPAVGEGKTPSIGAMDAFVATYKDAEQPLELLWNSGGINQREYVMEYLHRGFVPGSETWKRFRGRVVDSLRFPDQEMRQAAFLLLEKERDAAVADLALPMLQDADPEGRITALHALSAVGNPKYLPAAGGLIEDSDPAVRVQAAATVSKLAGLKPGSGETIEERAERWWKEHRGEATKIVAAQLDASEDYPLAPALHLLGIDGAAVDIQQLRGKVVLLNFWATWCGPCLQELPTLEKVAATHAADVVVVGICIDTAPDDDGDAASGTAADSRKKIEEVLKANGVTYRIALDNDGRAMNALGGEAVPTSILIDTTGHIRRRFVGVRNLEAWNAMIAEIAGAGAPK